MNENEKELGLYKTDFNCLVIYTKSFGVWFYKETIHRGTIDGMEFFRTARDHYSNLFGNKPYRIDIKWNTDTIKFNENVKIL